MSDLESGGRHRSKARGLVIDRFDPPHAGHHTLIRAALEQVDELHVAVCGREIDEPSAQIRSAWLREVHPDVRTTALEATRPPEDPGAQAEQILIHLGFRPDILFRPDAREGELARSLGCRLEVIPSAAAAIQVEESEIQLDPLKWWDALSSPVRGYYARRVCLVGAESTGKTTLARQLASHYETVWVPEYGREYTSDKMARERDAPWRTEEFIRIARTQCEMENAAARRCNRLLICDTDAFATSLWHRRYMGHPSPEVEAIAAEHRVPDLYLVTSVDTPFTPDEIRDGEALRTWMHGEFIRGLELQHRSFRLVAGEPRRRFSEAVAAIEELLAPGAGEQRSEWSDPGRRS